MSRPIEERNLTIDGIRVFARSVEGDGPRTVFVHGNPTNSTDWIPFLERSPGPAVAFDLPGFGRSERPDPVRFDHTLAAYANVVEHVIDELTGRGRYRLVVHDWGGLAVIPAQRHPERVERLVVMDAVPLVPGFRWHWVARIWRRRVLGEIFNATNTKASTRIALRQARSGYRAMPDEFVDEVWSNWDAGMRRAVLALYRSADPHVLAAYGSRLGELRCPALFLWGSDDPYTTESIGRAYADALPNARFEPVAGAGHWPWIDRPEVVGRVLTFLEGA